MFASFEITAAFFPQKKIENKSLMRDKSNDVASKGLELACFVAERIGELPDDNGSFAFEWESEGEGVRDARGDIKDDNRAVAGNEVKLELRFITRT